MRLPTEVLIRIFELLRDDCMRFDECRSLPVVFVLPKLFQWLAILEVCQHWNSVAKSCPTLWNQLLCDGRPGIALLPANVRKTYWEYFLRFSGDVPLRVSFHERGAREPNLDASPELTKAVANVFSHAHRFQELRLGGAVDADSLTIAAQRLTTLSVVDCLITETIPTTKTLFGGDLSSLRSLCVRDVQLQINPTRFLPSNYHRLRQIHLSGNLGGELTAELVATLEHTPHLEDLMFSRMRIHPLKRHQQKRLLILPRLKRFALDQVESANNILNFLGLPSGVFVSMHASLYHDNYILPTDRSRFADFQQMKKVKLQYPSQGSYDGQLFALSKSSALQAHLELWWGRPLPSNVRNTLTDVEELWIEGSYNSRPTKVPESRLWGRFKIPGLRRLVLDVDVGDYYSLWSCLEAFIPDAGEPVNCPSLEVLEIRIRSLEKAIIRQVWELLFIRMSRGCRVKKLRIGRFDKATPVNETTTSRRMAYAVKELAPLVDVLEFVDEETLPRMGPIPACVTPSTGAWQWPSWKDM